MADDQSSPALLDQATAHLAALRVAVNFLIQEAMLDHERRGGTRRDFLQNFLERGLQNLERTDFFAIPPERKPVVADMAAAAFTSLVGAIPSQGR